MFLCDVDRGVETTTLSMVVKCHSAHRFSRRTHEEPYRNPIKTCLIPNQRPDTWFGVATGSLPVLRDSAGFWNCTLMKRLYLGPSLHLVFKRQSVQFRPAVSFPDRAKLR